MDGNIATAAVTFYLVKDLMLIKTFENRSFNEVLKIVHLRTDLPSHTFFHHTVTQV